MLPRSLFGELLYHLLFHYKILSVFISHLCFLQTSLSLSGGRRQIHDINNRRAVLAQGPIIGYGL